MSKRDKENKKATKETEEEKPICVNLERQVLHLQIESLHERMKWRKLAIEKYKKETEIYIHDFKTEEDNMQEMVYGLESAIHKQDDILKDILKAISDAQRKKHHAEEANISQLKNLVSNINEQKTCNDEELAKVENDLKSLKDYDVQSTEETIQKAEQSLKELLEKNDSADKELYKKYQRCLKDEVKRLLDVKSKAFQEKTKSKVKDSSILKFAKFTKWRQNAINTLDSIEQELNNDAYITIKNISKLQNNLNMRRKNAVFDSLEIRKLIKRLEATTSKDGDQSTEIISVERIPDIDSQKELRGLMEKHKRLEDIYFQLQINESVIKELENEVSEEIAFGEYLSKVLKASQMLVEIEASKECNESQNLLYDLLFLFEKAIAYIHNAYPYNDKKKK